MPPFTILHVCMGNICRSPMAERLFRQALGDQVLSHSAGTGGWHEGEEMNPPAARQVRARGADPEGFSARKLRADEIDSADLILTATADQFDYVTALRPDSAERTFVLGEFGRLLKGVDASTLPAGDVYERGVALVRAVSVLRAGHPASPQDDLDDPWGRGDQVFSRVADEILATVEPFAALLLEK
ncbi:arsenate reductase/protein-tyrosine-phosphatase family protein [Rhizocola hellebori]|nr:phosphotyrosine protein phosphatase [Rhizocola hellebori]